MQYMFKLSDFSGSISVEIIVSFFPWIKGRDGRDYIDKEGCGTKNRDGPRIFPQGAIQKLLIKPIIEHKLTLLF